MHDDASLLVLRSFVKFDLVAAIVATVFVGVMAGVLSSPRLALAGLSVACLTGLLASVGRALDEGRTGAVIARVAVGNWIVAVAVSIAIPFLWPTMVLTALLPLVLAVPHLSPRGLGPMIAATAVFTAVVATIGVATSSVGAVRDLDEAVGAWAVVATVVVLIVPIAVIVAQNNGLQRVALDRSRLLNERLDESRVDAESSRRRVVDAADRERSRIERDLHDGAQQRLVALGMRLRLLEAQAPDPTLEATVQSLIVEIDLTIDELRDLARGIYPPMLEAQGLNGAFAAVVRRSTQRIATDLAPVGRFDPAIETAVYFAGLEALTNAAKHAAHAECRITLAHVDDEVRLDVVDDGDGFDDTAERRGLLNMTDRVAAVGGTCSIVSTDGVGTTVRISVPTI